MKTTCLLLLLHMAAQPAIAQSETHHTPRASSLRANKKNIDGFTVLLQPAIRRTYLFSIYLNGKLIYHSTRNPVTLAAQGFVNRSEAYKAAGWAIKAYRKDSAVPDRMPFAVIKQMGLSTNAHQQPK